MISESQSQRNPTAWQNLRKRHRLLERIIGLGFVQIYCLLSASYHSVYANRVNNVAQPDTEAESQPADVASTLGKRKKSSSEAHRQKRVL